MLSLLLTLEHHDNKNWFCTLYANGTFFQLQLWAFWATTSLTPTPTTRRRGYRQLQPSPTSPTSATNGLRHTLGRSLSPWSDCSMKFRNWTKAKSRTRTCTRPAAIVFASALLWLPESSQICVSIWTKSKWTLLLIWPSIKLFRALPKSLRKKINWVSCTNVWTEPVVVYITLA